MPPKPGVNKRRPAKSANPAKRVSVAAKDNADVVTELQNGAPKAKVNHFLGKHIDIDRLREPADFSGVFRITHDIKIGFNKFDMFLDRFESQKRVVRNNNFKLITGKGTQSKSRQIEQKKEDVTEHIKNKRMITHLMQLREIGMALDDVCWGTDFVDEEILDRYVARLREQIQIEKEKTQGVYKPVKKEKAKAKSKSNVEVQAVQPQHQLADQKKQQETQQEQQTSKTAETANNKEDADFFGTTETSALTMTAGQSHMKRFETMNEEQMIAYRDQCIEREKNRQIADMLMNPSNNLEHLNKEEFSKLLAIENVFDDVANRIFNLHNVHNKKLNEQYPLMIKLETSVQKVKQALYELDQVSFRELRDLKLTPSQIYARTLQKQARIKYSVVDDMREVIGNESLTRDPFCGIIDKLLKQKAKEMGKLKKGYGAYYLDEITNHADELPCDEKCIKSLLSKENTLRHKADEILAKKLLKAARAKSHGAKVGEEEQRHSSPIAAAPPYQVPPREPRVKTLSEIQAEKAAMLKRQQEKLVRDRQLVLDNIYLMRLKEMYPDAQVTCSDHIQNLIDAFMRRNMVQQEIMEELALEKLKKKKPRPHKLIKGLAIVRPNMFEYLDNDPAGLIEKEARQRALAADSSDEEPPKHGQVHESVQTAMRGENEESEDSEEQVTNASKSAGEQRRRSDQRIQVKQLDMTKLQVKENSAVQKALGSPQGEPASSSGGEEIPDMHEKLEYALNTDSKGEEVLASEDHTIQAASGKSLSAQDKNEEVARDSPTADFTNDGRAITSQQHEKDLISDRTIRESYLASLGPESQGKVDHRKHRRMVNSVGGEIASGEQQIKQPIHSEHHAEGQGQGEVSDGRESPGFQLNLMGNPPLGMFEQKSDDVSRTESKPHASRLGKQGAIHHHRTARHHLDMERLGMRETRFMDRIRQEAQERRGKHQRPTTLSSLRKERQVRGSAGRKQRISTLDNRFASSARTIEFQDKSRARAASPNDKFNPMILSANITRSGGRSPDGNMEGGIVSNQSFINSQLGSAYNASKSNLRQNQPYRNSTLHTTINQRTSQQDYAQNACPSDVTWQKDTFETRQPPSSNAVLRSLGINPGAAKQSTKKNFYTKPILSYTMPITGDRTTQNSLDEKKVKEMANPLAATQKRFPLREAHTVHIRRRLEANPHLTQKVLQESESTVGGMNQKKTGQLDTQSVSKQQKRPVTGKTRDSTTVDRTQVLSKIGTMSMNKPASVRQMSILQHLMRPQTANQRKVNVGVATDSYTEQEEFCQVHESELPDRILSFMENNDLPVFVDKKKCNTIRYRTTHHERLDEFDQMQQPIGKLNIVPDSAFIRPLRPLAQVQTAELLNTQHLSLGMTLVLDPEANKNFQAKGDTLTDLQNMLLAAESDPRKHIRPVSSKPTFKKTVTQGEPTSPDLDDTALQIEKEKSVTSASAAARTQSFRRRVVVQSNTQAESTDKSPIGASRQGKFATHPRNETPQIINIVGNSNTGQINQDLGNDLIDSNGVKGNEQGSSIGTATERNTTFDNRDTLPRPLYLKSRTQREARNSAKMRVPSHKAEKRRQTAKPNSNMGRNSSTSHMGNQVRIQTNQLLQAQRRSKAFTPTVAADTAIEPATHDDVLSADHPMVGYVAKAAYAEPYLSATPQYEDM